MDSKERLTSLEVNINRMEIDLERRLLSMDGKLSEINEKLDDLLMGDNSVSNRITKLQIQSTVSSLIMGGLTLSFFGIIVYLSDSKILNLLFTSVAK